MEVYREERELILNEASEESINSLKEAFGGKLSDEEIRILINAALTDNASSGINDINSEVASLARKQVKINVSDNEVEAAKRRLDALRDAANRNYTATVRVSGSQKYAEGGIAENHSAQIATQGWTRVWNEPETGGEAYIPLAAAKRARSLEIWRQVGARLGAYRSFADGGIVGGASASGGAYEARLVGGKLRVAGDGLMELVDARVQIGLAGRDNYAASRSRR